MGKGLFDVFLGALVVTAVSSITISAFPQTDSRPRNLVVVILNSIRYSDTFGDKRHLYVETIWKKIKPHGTLCKNVYNNYITMPLPAQSVLLTGVCPAKTDTLSAGRPTLFEYYRKQTGVPQNRVLFVVGDSGSMALACNDNADYGKMFAPNILVNDTADLDINAFCDKTVAYLKVHHPSLVVFSLATGKTVDYANDACGLHSGESGDACGTGEFLNRYYEGIIGNDMIIGNLWEFLQTDAFYKDNTIFLIVSSQGRHTDDYSSYGDACKGCAQLMFLVSGPGVKKNCIRGNNRYLTDVLPTIGALLGIKTEYATGNIMKEVLSKK